MAVPSVNLQILETLFAQMERNDVRYGLGAKAEGGSDPRNNHRWNPRSNGSLSTPVNSIDNIDCSGFVRYALFHATNGALDIGDGSQNQRGWCEHKAAAGELHAVQSYANSAKFINAHRLFICFIKPNTNGCGPVGHVWLVTQYDDGDNHTLAGTLESHGGTGINSRPWNSKTLVREFFSAYELPTA